MRRLISLLSILILLATAARADEIFGAGFPSVTGYMADDGTTLYYIPGDHLLRIFSAQGDYEISLPPECGGIWRMDYTDPENLTLICGDAAPYAVVPIRDGAPQPAIALPGDALILHRPLGDHVYYHTRDSRLCRFNWATGEEQTLLPRTGGLYHADRWYGVDYLVVSLPDEKGVFHGGHSLLTVDADGRCSGPLALPEGMDFAAGPLCVTPWGDVLIAGTARAGNTGALYCYSSSGRLLWQAPAECQVCRLIPTREGFTVVGHRGGPVVRREIDRNGTLTAEQVYKAFAPGSGFPVVDGEVYCFPFTEDDPRFIPLV